MENKEAIRIVLLGQTSACKSSTCNTLAGEEKLDSKCEALSVMHKNRCYLVLDTPGLFDTKRTEEDMHEYFGSVIDSGPHVFIIIINLNRFDIEEKKTIELISDIFGENVFEHSVVLFTGLDDLKSENLTLKNYIEESNENLKELVNLCNGLYIGIKNGETDIEIRKKILEMIDKISENQKEHYTIEKFKRAARKYQEKLIKIELEREKEMKKIDVLKREYDKEISKIRIESDPVIQQIKKKWYQKIGNDLIKLFKRKK